MSRVSPLIAALCFTLVALFQDCTAQANAAPNASTSVVQVAYLIEGNSLLTYNVDPQTLNATQVGTLKVEIPSSYYNYWLAPSPNGHFLYFVSADTSFHQHLWVYQTDATGAPQNPPVQVMKIEGQLWGLQFDPQANFAYTVNVNPYTGFQSTFYLRRYVVDPATGRLSQPETQATYVLSTDPSGADCGLALFGFSPKTTQLYDAVVCYNHDNSAATYYQRTLNAQTGALGPDVQIYSWVSGMTGGESVQFIGGLMYDFVVPNTFQQGINQVNIYPAIANTHQPVVQCTAQMLEACGYATSGKVHPSGKYLFMQISPDTFQIDRVELGQKKIVDTGSYLLLQWLSQFSPDGSLIYGIDSSGSFIQVYGFDGRTAVVTTGGTIPLANYSPVWTAERY